MTLTPYNILGILGVIFILAAYLALQLERLDPKFALYSVLNAIGAALILLSLYFDFNLSAMLIESAWLVISILGFSRRCLRGNRWDLI